MKYQVGDFILIKDIHLLPRHLLRLPPLLRPRPRLLLQDTLGIITAVEKHSDIFPNDSTENDNGYILYSQVDGNEYYFYENEVEGEILK
jgi:hypothetical protein